MTQNPAHMELLRTNGKKAARVTGDGRIFIGDTQVMPDHPIAENGISVMPTFHGRYNVLTVSFIVGAVELENRTPGDNLSVVEPTMRAADIAEASLANVDIDHLDPCICTVDTRDGSIRDYDCGREIAQRRSV